MKNSKLLKAYLVLSGVLLTIIGGATLIAPVAFKASAEIDVVGNVNLLNDVRAFGALALGLAGLNWVGLFSKKVTYTAALVIPLFFLTIGLGRVISLLLDGTPADGLFKATILELVLGILGTVLFRINRIK